MGRNPQGLAPLLLVGSGFRLPGGSVRSRPAVYVEKAGTVLEPWVPAPPFLGVLDHQWAAPRIEHGTLPCWSGESSAVTDPCLHPAYTRGRV